MVRSKGKRMNIDRRGKRGKSGHKRADRQRQRRVANREMQVSHGT